MKSIISDRQKLSSFLLRIIGFSLSISVLVWIYYKIDLGLLCKSFADLQPFWLLFMASIYLFGFLIRGLRWQFMLLPIKNVGIKSATEGVIIGYMGNNILPARAGEFMRAIFLGHRESISKTSVLGTVLIERVFDGLVLVTIMIICSLLLKRDGINYGVINAIIVTGCLIFGVAVGFILVGAYRRLWLEAHLGRLKNYLPEKLSERLLPIITKLLNSFNIVSAYKTLFVVLVLSIIVWSIEGLVFWIGLIAFHFPPHFLVAYFTLALVNLWMILPSAPGGVGVFQGATVFAFSVFGLSPENALSFSIVVHAVMIIPITLMGLYTINRYNFSIRKIT